MVFSDFIWRPPSDEDMKQSGGSFVTGKHVFVCACARARAKPQTRIQGPPGKKVAPEWGEKSQQDALDPAHFSPIFFIFYW